MFTIMHKQASKPAWYHLEYAKDLDSATQRARQYALDNGGNTRVQDRNGAVVFEF